MRRPRTTRTALSCRIHPRAEAGGGTYTVNEADHSIFMEIIGSSFPTWDNTYQKRFITITGDEMKYINPTPATGGGTAMVILKRAE